MLTIGNGMNFVTFVPISTSFGKYYELPHIAVDMFTMIYMSAYPIVSFPESNFIDNVSMKYGVSILY